MNGKELAYFKDIVQEKIDVILSHQLGTEANTTCDASGDLSGVHTHMADSSLGVDEIDRHFACNTREWRYLHHLNEALRRIEDGEYGICRTCGKEIDRARLEAVPHATQCFECKSREEMGWRAQ